MTTAANKLTGLRVPALIMSPVDVSRLRREVTALDDYMRQQVLRQSGQPTPALPKVSRLLDELASSNKLNLLDSETRQHLAAFLTDVATNAPVVRISFAVDPSSGFLQKIVEWFRREVHPAVLVRVGLQPGIAAGCIVQTTNRYFDLSLQHYLQSHRNLLLDALGKPAEPMPTITVPVLPAEQQP